MVEYQQKEKYFIGDLIDIVSLLRGEGGCPWDMVQTHESIKTDFIEETYEVLEAIDCNDSSMLREELGDVLLQVVFHTVIEQEKSAFTFDDVCDEVCKKLIVRHPHVFGDTIAEDTETVLKNWNDIKMKTKGQETYTDTLRSVAKPLPALMYAQKVGKRAMRAGMDFSSTEDAFSCIEKERRELEEAIAEGNAEHISDELGDLLFSCVNVARHLGIDAETALRAATEKFINRFEITERLISGDSLDMKSLSIEEIDQYWEKAKNINQED